MDRHLFALQALAKKELKRNNPEASDEEIAEALPKLYHDPSWRILNHNILSTSTLASATIEGGGFGPVVEDGYGIGYGVRDHKMGFVISTYRGDAKEMAAEMETALLDILRTLKGEENSTDLAVLNKLEMPLPSD